MLNKEIYTHIQGGKHKGRKIKLPSLSITRASKSILKESFFNVIRANLYDSVFIEAFSGSGSVGLEAISQGAKKSYFIEYDKEAFKVLEQNCSFLDRAKYALFNKNSFEFLGTLIDSIYLNKELDIANEQSNLIVYLDPPFSTQDNVYDKCMDSLSNIECIKNKQNVLIVFEKQTKIPTKQRFSTYTLAKTSKFGNSSLSYYKNK